MKFYKIVLSSTAICGALGNTLNYNEKVDVRGDLIVEGNTKTDQFTCPSMMGSGDCDSNKDVAANKLKSTEGIADEAHVDTLKPPQGTLDIDSDLIITDPVTIQKFETVGIEAYGQQLDWGLFAMDTFNAPDQMIGWSYLETASCQDSRIYQDIFLGGHCKLSDQEVSKTFYNIPKHKHMSIMAKFHMFDYWKGEYGYMKVNDELVWKEHATCSDRSGSMNLCGGADSDPGYNVPIEYAFAHSDDRVKITFGSTLTKDPCEASYGVDDVMLFIA